MCFSVKAIFWTGLVFWLAGCQTVSTHSTQEQSKELQPGRYAILHDSAPTGPIPRFFKSFIPKAEPLSPYGNPVSYRVGGKTYYVMKSARGYKARGLASWYASKFHRQRTSSGEPYDMYALTAAHRTLPLPTYLKVKNLQNGRQIIVKVNDRGPFHQSRLIDLSYGAAVKLGIFPRGTAPVEIEAIYSFNQSAPIVKGERFYVQVGAFQSMVSARQLRTKITQITHENIVVEHYSGKYFVRVGPYASRRQSELMRQQLVRKGLKGAFLVMM